MRDLVVDEPVAGDEAVSVLPGQCLRDKGSAGAFHDESTGRDVPESDPGLDVGIEAAAGDVSEGQRGRAHDADLAHAVGEFEEVGLCGLQAVLALGESE